jgi:uncharacterized protein (TIGR02284 family)
MSHNQDLRVDHLNHLTAINRDAEGGFRAGAETIQNSELETLFAGFARRHAKFATELREEITRIGGTVTDAGTIGGALHKGWMELKSALSGHSSAAVLGSCESGEESAEIAYNDVCDLIPAGQTHTLLEKQRQQIKEIRTHLARLVGEMRQGVAFQQNE